MSSISESLSIISILDILIGFNELLCELKLKPLKKYILSFSIVLSNFFGNSAEIFFV